jgi:tellurite resistance protein TerC
VPASIGSPLFWIGFTAFVLAMLLLDLGVFHRKAHTVGQREALIWSSVWIGLSLAFNAILYAHYGSRIGTEFLTGYIIEKSLSVDNIFVFLIIFQYFGVPLASQHRVLFWGILGALVMRAAFILIGTVLLERFHWIIYIFGAFLVYTGIKMLQGKEVEVHPERNPAVRLFQKYFPLTNQYTEARFWVRSGGKLFATPLMLVLVVVEATDLIFAVDSIPAIFAVTRDPFIVYTSNVFAILGLRSLYFLLAASMKQFRYLKLGLGLVLSFVGLKMLASGFYEIPIVISLAVVAIILGATIGASIVRGPKEPGVAPQPDQTP